MSKGNVLFLFFHFPEGEDYMLNNNVCPYCGFLKPAIRLACESCTEEYEALRLYIEKQPLSNMMEISNSTKISLKKIRLYIEKGHFSIKL
jgi:ribosomal protein L40E